MNSAAVSLKISKIYVPQTPEPRQGHTAVHYQNQIIVFAGRVSSSTTISNIPCYPPLATNNTKQIGKRALTNALWVYSISENVWKQIIPQQPAASSATSTSQNQQTIWPCARHNHTAVVHSHYMYIFGGSNNATYLNDMFRLNLETFEWQLIHNNNDKTVSCTPRHGHTAVVLQPPAGGEERMIIFGGKQGFGNDGVFLNDIHSFQFSTNKWSPVKANNQAPLGRCWHTATAFKDADGSVKMLVFGGFFMKKKKEFYYNDLSFFCFSALAWQVISPASSTLPHARNRHAMVLLKHDNEQDVFLMFGGNYLTYNPFTDVFLNDFYLLTRQRKSQRCSNDIWTWTLLLDHQGKHSNQFEERGHHSAMLTGANTITVFGGEKSKRRFSDLVKIEF